MESEFRVENLIEYDYGVVLIEMNVFKMFF